MNKQLKFLTLFLFIFSFSLQAQIQSPDDFLGFPVGADRQLADYHQISAYLSRLAQSSPRISVFNLGKTTDGNDMVIAVISSAENIRNLEKIKKANYQLAHPENLTGNQAENLIKSGKVTAFITCNIHSTEIGASQMSMEFAYELATRDDAEAKFYLDNVVLILMPSANPDGQIMVTDWYRKWVGTEYEGGRMPWLYHRYVGHDDNRDFYMLNMKESKLINKVMSQEWFPQVHLDEHQMGSTGPRMFVPPYKDPMSPHLSPLLLRMEALYGSNMSFRLEENDKPGVIDSWAFDSYWPGGTRTAAWKNIVSLLTEMASCRIATPIYIEENELSGGRKGLAEYKQQINFPNPWRGGWWRLRDIIDYELIASYSFLETSAKYREGILRGFYQMNLQGIEKGKTESPFAFIVPANQSDPITAGKMIEILLRHGLQIYQTKSDVIIGNKFYPTGSVVIPTAQSLRSFIMEMLDIQRYPEVKLSRETEPLYPYDVTAWSLPLLMGVKCDRIEEPVAVEMSLLKEAPYPQGEISGQTSFGYAISSQYNQTTRAIHRLLKQKIDIYVALQPFSDSDASFPAGTVLIPADKINAEKMKAVAENLHLPIHALRHPLPENKVKVDAKRVGLYKPWRASIDEGWTRWLLEQFEFDLVSVTNDMIKKGDLNKQFDVLIIPDIGKNTIINPKPKNARFYRPLPPKYEGGIGKQGVKNIKDFVQKGGVLITLDDGYQLPVEEFPLPVSNALKNLKRSEYNAPGCMVKARINTNHPIGWGMPEEFAAFLSNSPAFRTSIPGRDIDRRVVAYYPEEPLLLSGWIRGEKLLQRKAAIVDVKFGEGKVILLGFRVQHRAQPYGTFKLLFNAIHFGNLKITEN
ncbi:MAG: hypothetical protein GXO74_08895 [Calditrichaeota bacterium]|nr:hypothetical protein [Calditrichota bacterium]